MFEIVRLIISVRLGNDSNQPSDGLVNNSVLVRKNLVKNCKGSDLINQNGFSLGGGMQ